MKPSIQTLGRILYSPSQYVIPVFQRNYRWGEPQWGKLWENVIEIQGPSKKGNHFLGFLVFVPGLPQPGQNTTFYLVDGQQRLASSSILLAAVRNIARQQGHEELADEIHQYYLVHPLKKGDQHYRLLPKERDHDSYLALINGKGDAAGRMADALGYFEDRITTYAADSPDKLWHVFHTICQRLEFMCATLETENAYNIFKSLNSTGVPLGPADLIRNFVFLHVSPTDQDAFDRDLWTPLEDHFVSANGTLDEERFSKFFRDYLMSKPDGGYMSPKETFQSFESQYAATGFSPRELAHTLITSAQHYAVISGQRADESIQVTQALAGLNQLESSTTYPLLLALFARRASGRLESERLAHAIKMLCGFIFRRFICGESSRGYGRIFVRAVGLGGDDPLAVLESYLVDRGWPDDRQFKAAFVEFPLFQRGYTREVLVTLERARGHKEPADLRSAQIEHILPQTLSDEWRKALGSDAERIHADWLHRPGNLTLSAYNQHVGNQPFTHKRDIYAASNISLTRELASYERWGEADIQMRGQHLAEAAARIWIGPTSLPRPTTDRSDSRDNDTGSKVQRIDTQQLKLEYWQRFQQLVAEQGKLIKPRKALPQHWANFALGRSGFNLQAAVNTHKKRINVGIELIGPKAKLHYQLLHQQREEIEQAFGEALTWSELPGKQSSYISLYRPESSLRDRSSWPAQHAWLLEKLELFHRVFGPRVKTLDTSMLLRVGTSVDGAAL